MDTVLKILLHDNVKSNVGVIAIVILGCIATFRITSKLDEIQDKVTTAWTPQDMDRWAAKLETKNPTLHAPRAIEALQQTQQN